MEETPPSKVEFAVKIKSLSCVENVKKRLLEIGIKNEAIESFTDGSNQECRMVIKTVHPWVHLQETIEKGGSRAVLVGFSDQAAVVMLDKGSKNIKGVVRFCSITSSNHGIVVDGVVDGLKPNETHTLSICEFGDISQGFESIGDVYKNSSYKIQSDGTGRSLIRTVDYNLSVSELIGRSIALTSFAGTKLGFGIISRSAGVFQNWKRICQCDGVSIWDERDRPITGAARRI